MKCHKKNQYNNQLLLEGMRNHQKIASHQDYELIVDDHKTWIQAQRAFSQPLNTIFVLQIDKNMKNGLVAAANWLMGNKVSAKKKFICQYQQMKGRETNIKFSHGSQVYILNADHCRVVCTDVSWLLDHDVKIEEKTRRLFTLRILNKLAEYWKINQNKKIKIYCALKTRSDNEITKFKKLINCEPGILLCGDQEENPNPTINNMTIEAYSQGKCEFTSEELFSDIGTSHNLRQIFKIGQQGSNEKRFNWLIERQEMNSKIIYYLINPIKEGLMNICDGKEVRMSELYMPIFSRILKSRVEETEDFVNIFRKNILKNHTSKSKLKLKSLDIYYFLIEIQEEYKTLMKEKQAQRFQKFIQFLSNILNKLIDYQMCSYELVKIVISICFTLISQNIFVKEICSQNNFKFRGFLTTNLNDIWKKIFEKQNKEKLYTQIINKPLQSNQQQHYYDQIKTLPEKFINLSKGIMEISAQKANEIIVFQQKVEMNKANSLINSAEAKKNKKVAVKAIIGLFNVWKHRKLNLEEINFDQILQKCAKSLKQIGHPELAIEIYKEMKLVFKVQECLFEMINFQMDEIQKQRHYKDMAKYFRSINYHDMSRKYAQLALEQNMEARYQFVEGIVKFQKNDEDPEKKDFAPYMLRKLRLLQDQEFAPRNELKIVFSPSERLPRILQKIK